VICQNCYDRQIADKSQGPRSPNPREYPFGDADGGRPSLIIIFCCFTLFGVINLLNILISPRFFDSPLSVSCEYELTGLRLIGKGTKDPLSRFPLKDLLRKHLVAWSTTPKYDIFLEKFSNVKNAFWQNVLIFGKYRWVLVMVFQKIIFFLQR